MNKDNKKWYKLDNAAKMIPPTSTRKNPNIFRLSATLKNDIKENLLKNAVNNALELNPLFSSTLKKGLFWFYLEETNFKANISKESLDPCSRINGPLLFNVTYNKKRINLEVNHALTDGVGAMTFFNMIIINYLKKVKKDSNNYVFNTSSVDEASSDSYSKYCEKPHYKFSKSNKVYKIKQELTLENRLRVIEGIINIEDLKLLSKKENTTVTVFITAVLIYSIINNMKIKEYKKDIAIEVPVNLRSFFKSNTNRNFFNTVKIKYNPKKNGLSFDEIISTVKEEFSNNITKEKLRKQMNNYHYLERNLIIRFIPLFIKNFVIKSIFKIIKKDTTVVYSNVGIATLPKEFSDDVINYTVLTNTDNIKLCSISYGKYISLAFTSKFEQAEIEKDFFRFFTKENIKVKINANEVQ